MRQQSVNGATEIYALNQQIDNATESTIYLKQWKQHFQTWSAPQKQFETIDSGQCMSWSLSDSVVVWLEYGIDIGTIVSNRITKIYFFYRQSDLMRQFYVYMRSRCCFVYLLICLLCHLYILSHAVKMLVTASVRCFIYFSLHCVCVDHMNLCIYFKMCIHSK